MNPLQNVAYGNTSRLAATGTRGRVSHFNEAQPSRVPDDFKDLMMHILVKPTAEPKSKSTSAMATGARAGQHKTQPVQPTPGKWKSSFKPIDQENPEDQSQEQSSNERTEFYDPYDPPIDDLLDVNLWDVNSNSPPEQDDNFEWPRSPPQQEEWQRSSAKKDDNLKWQHSPPQRDEWQRSPPEKDDNLEWRHMSPNRSSRVTPPWRLSRESDVYNLRPESRRSESHVVSPDCRRPSEQQSCSPDMSSSQVQPGQPRKPFGYGSRQRAFSPDRRTDSSPSLQYSVSYGRDRTNREEMTRPEYRSPKIPRVTSSSPTLQRDYENEELVEAEPAPKAQMSRIKRKMRKSVRMDQITINCDLCDIEVSNGHELEIHLQSKIHWDTMEHIQNQNNYDDMTIAFLQDVMLYKSIKCNRAIDCNALEALQGDHHMTKVSLFHCAACQILVSTAAAAVQNHINSPEHLFNTKEFEAQRRRASLDKADTIMKQLQPQYENFIKGFRQFE